MKRRSRIFTNYAEIVSAVRARWPLVPLIEIEPGVSRSLRETLLIFANSTVVIGPHGAGSSNAVAMMPGSTLIETIVDSTHFRRHSAFAALCRMIGVSYRWILSEGDKRANVTPSPTDIIALIAAAMPPA